MGVFPRRGLLVVVLLLAVATVATVSLFDFQPRGRSTVNWITGIRHEGDWAWGGELSSGEGGSYLWGSSCAGSLTILHDAGGKGKPDSRLLETEGKENACIARFDSRGALEASRVLAVPPGAFLAVSDTDSNGRFWAVSPVPLADAGSRPSARRAEPDGRGDDLYVVRYAPPLSPILELHAVSAQALWSASPVITPDGGLVLYTGFEGTLALLPDSPSPVQLENTAIVVDKRMGGALAGEAVAIVSFGSAGDVRWCRTIEGPGGSEPEAMVAHPDGSLTALLWFSGRIGVKGRERSVELGSDAPAQQSKPASYYALIRYESDGELRWARTLDVSTNLRATRMTASDRGAVLVAGMLDAAATFVGEDTASSGRQAPPYGQGDHVVCLRVNSDGGFDWVKRLTGAVHALTLDQSGEVAVDALEGGDFYLGFLFKGNVRIPYSDTPELSARGLPVFQRLKRGLGIVRCNRDGEIEWASTAYTGYWLRPSDVVAVSKDEVVVMGVSGGRLTVCPDGDRPRVLSSGSSIVVSSFGTH